ncbi:MAG: hypothetical protein WAL04_08450, partial [Acidimicrobiales bacterium]
GQIGVEKEVVGRARPAVRQGDAHAHSDPEPFSPENHRLTKESYQMCSVGDGDPGVEAGPDDESELVIPDPTYRHVRARPCEQPLSDDGQHLVANLMPERPVDDPEPIDIQQDERDSWLTSH